MTAIPGYRPMVGDAELAELLGPDDGAPMRTRRSAGRPEGEPHVLRPPKAMCECAVWWPAHPLARKGHAGRRSA